MRKHVGVAGVMAVGMLVCAGAGQAAGMKEGRWSMTTAIRMDGMDEQAAEAMRAMDQMSPEDKAMMQQMMGGMKIGGPGGGMGMSTTRTQCLTNDDPVPQANDEKDCRHTHTIKGDTVNFEVVCAHSRSTGHVTYHNDSMKGTIQSTSTEHGRPQQVTIDISGQYVGPCE